MSAPARQALSSRGAALMGMRPCARTISMTQPAQHLLITATASKHVAKLLSADRRERGVYQAMGVEATFTDMV